MREKCCPIWTLLKIVLIIAAAALVVMLVLNKMQMLGSFHQSFRKDEWTEGDETTDPETMDGVPYTTDQDFV